MSPTPSPALTAVTSQVGGSAAPWWGVPLLAGCFLLLGATIAFTSTYFSDQRKLKRDDQRQWDREIRECWVIINTAVDQIRQIGHSGVPRVEDGFAYHKASEASQAIDAQIDTLQLIAVPATTEAANKVLEVASRITGSLHDRIKPPKRDFVVLGHERNALLAAVKLNLRIAGEKNRDAS